MWGGDIASQEWLGVAIWLWRISVLFFSLIENCFFSLLTSFRSLIGNPFFLSFVLFSIFTFLFFLSFHFFLVFLFTFPSPSLSLGNRVLTFHSLSLEEIPLAFASGERMRILFIGQGSKGLRLCFNRVFYHGNPILIYGAKQIWVTRCRSRAELPHYFQRHHYFQSLGSMISSNHHPEPKIYNS